MPAVFSNVRRRSFVLVALVLAGPAVDAGAGCTLLQPIPGTPVPGDTVVAGTVTRVEISRNLSQPTIVHLTVDRVLRGTAGRAVVVKTAPTSAQCGVNFEVGGRYLVSARRGVGDGPYGTGNLVVSSGDHTRPLRSGESVGPLDLRWPAPPSFNTRASNLVPHQFVDLRGFGAYWTGAEARSQPLVAMRRSASRVVVLYGGRGTRISIVTERVCVRPQSMASAPAFDRLRSIRGAIAGIRAHRLEVFTGGRRVVVTGGTADARLWLARRMFLNHRRTATWRVHRMARPTRRAFRRLVSCAAVRTARPVSG
ncbi:MAG: hypothetical protein R2878_11875 [Thermoleophilia bacterium]